MLKFKNLGLLVSISIILFLVFMIKPCYAVELDLVDDSTSDSQTTDEDSTDTQTNTNARSTRTNTNTDSLDNTSTTNTSNYETTAATVTSSLPENEMGLSNILNIFLIVIGILLILLAIAILIRLKH